MRLGYKLGIIVWLVSLSGVSCLSKPQRKLKKEKAVDSKKLTWLDKINEADFEALNKALLALAAIDKPLEKKPIPGDKVMTIFDQRVMEGLQPAEKSTALRLYSGSIATDLTVFTNFNKNAKTYTCPEYKEDTPMIITNLSVLNFERIRKSLGEFVKIYALWYKGTNLKFKGQNEINELKPEDALLIQGNANKILPKFTQFYQNFTGELDVFEKELEKYTCGIKDFLIFYDALFRFYTVYKEVPQSTTRDMRLTEVALVWVRWQKRFAGSVKIIRFLKVITEEFGEYLKYVESGQQTDFLLQFQSINLQILNTVTYCYKRLNEASSKYVAYFKVLRKSVAGLEHSIKWDLPPLLYPKNGWIVGALIVGLISVLFK